MDPVIKDPGSKESSKGCSASKQVVDNGFGAKEGFAKECAVWGCSPNVWLPYRVCSHGAWTWVPHVCYIYIFITIYSICTICNTVVSTSVQFNVPSCERAGRLAIHDCTLFGTVVSMVSFRLPNRSHSDCRIAPHLCDVKVLPYCTNR